MEARELFISGAAGFGESQFTSRSRYLPEQNVNNFTVDELLDFSKHDEVTTDDFIDGAAVAGCTSTVTVVDSCNSSISGGFDGSQFSGNLSCRSFTDAPFTASEFYVLYDEMEELEWLSNFVDDDTFSSDEVHNLQLILATKTSAAPVINASDSMRWSGSLALMLRSWHSTGLSDSKLLGYAAMEEQEKAQRE